MKAKDLGVGMTVRGEHWLKPETILVIHDGMYKRGWLSFDTEVCELTTSGFSLRKSEVLDGYTVTNEKGVQIWPEEGR